jgi:hypothetical protein
MYPLFISTDCVTSFLWFIFILLCWYVFICAPGKGPGIFLFVETQYSRGTTRLIHCKAQRIQPDVSSDSTRKRVVYAT